MHQPDLTQVKPQRWCHVDPATASLIAAQRRPHQRAIITQRWEHLFFYHWKYDAKEIQQRLPSGLIVDRYEGQAYLSIVGFRMSSIRPFGLPAVPFLSELNELNVRTYVRTADGKPGIFFFSLDCDHWLAVKIAQLAFGLNYQSAKLDLKTDGPHPRLSCLRHRQTAEAHFAWEPTGSATVAIPGTLEFFLLERYIFFTQRNNQLWMGQVHHAPYAFTPAIAHEWSEAPLLWNGLLPTGSAPNLIHASPGVSIEAFPLARAHA